MNSITEKSLKALVVEREAARDLYYAACAVMDRQHDADLWRALDTATANWQAAAERTTETARAELLKQANG